MEDQDAPHSSARIKAIDAEAIHRICSGQVITQLSVAVKELVENALDAGATTVDVRLKEFGSESIEVIDNGSGIRPQDYEGLTAKYHTSKISEFNDIVSVSSFGFRGEAISSLCEVAGAFTVITRTADQAAGNKLEYDRAGRLVKTTPVARAVGTTVIVSDLFKPLPVRHREFLRNCKKQYAKTLLVLQAYALISSGVRLLVTNIVTGSLAAASAGGSGGSSGAGGVSVGAKRKSVTASWDIGGSGHSNKRQSLGACASSNTGAGAVAVDDEVDDEAVSAVAASIPTSLGRHSVLATSGGASMRDCIIDVFGMKFMQALDGVSVEVDAAASAAAAPSSRDTATSSAAEPAPTSAAPEGVIASATTTVVADDDGQRQDGGGGSRLEVTAPSSSASPSAVAVLSVPVLPVARAAPAASGGQEITGFISKAGTGVGRSNNDKQFMYINSRPVDVPKVNKAINEVWRQYEMGHKPAYILNLRLSPGAFDVNVTPDKREVFLVNESKMIECLKQALHKLWEPSRRTFAIGGVGGSSSGGGLSGINGDAGLGITSIGFLSPAVITAASSGVVDSADAAERQHISSSAAPVTSSSPAGTPATSASTASRMDHGADADDAAVGSSATAASAAPSATRVAVPDGHAVILSPAAFIRAPEPTLSTRDDHDAEMDGDDDGAAGLAAATVVSAAAAAAVSPQQPQYFTVPSTTLLSPVLLLAPPAVTITADAAATLKAQPLASLSFLPLRSSPQRPYHQHVGHVDSAVTDAMRASAASSSPAAASGEVGDSGDAGHGHGCCHNSGRLHHQHGADTEDEEDDGGNMLNASDSAGDGVDGAVVIISSENCLPRSSPARPAVGTVAGTPATAASRAPAGSAKATPTTAADTSSNAAPADVSLSSTSLPSAADIAAAGNSAVSAAPIEPNPHPWFNNRSNNHVNSNSGNNSGSIRGKRPRRVVLEDDEEDGNNDQAARVAEAMGVVAAEDAASDRLEASVHHQAQNDDEDEVELVQAAAAGAADTDSVDIVVEQQAGNPAMTGESSAAAGVSSGSAGTTEHQFEPVDMEVMRRKYAIAASHRGGPSARNSSNAAHGAEAPSISRAAVSPDDVHDHRISPSRLVPGYNSGIARYFLDVAATDHYDDDGGGDEADSDRAGTNAGGGDSGDTGATAQLEHPFASSAPVTPAAQYAAAGFVGADATAGGIIDAAAMVGAIGSSSLAACAVAAAAGSAGSAGSTAATSSSPSSSSLSAAAEETLTRVLTKHHFNEMSRQVVGQFNLGFIVAGTGSDLFILDQHACDEKYTYEQLRSKTVIHQQRLLIPRPIQLTAAEEMTVLEHMDVFNANGFHFQVAEQGPGATDDDDGAHLDDDDDDGAGDTAASIRHQDSRSASAHPRSRLLLTAIPFSKGTTFGDEDVRELCSLLSDADDDGDRRLRLHYNNSPGRGQQDNHGSGAGADRQDPGRGSGSSVVRLPKVNTMFASRACRSAIMIGTALKRDTMRRVVQQMSALHQPWNCPHGRPTMRHLVDIGSAAVQSQVARVVEPGPEAI